MDPFQDRNKITLWNPRTKHIWNAKVQFGPKECTDDQEVWISFASNVVFQQNYGSVLNDQLGWLKLINLSLGKKFSFNNPEVEIGLRTKRTVETIIICLFSVSNENYPIPFPIVQALQQKYMPSYSTIVAMAAVFQRLIASCPWDAR